MDVPAGTHDHHTDRPARRRTVTRTAAGTTAVLLTIGLGLAGTPAANAAGGDESRAAARFVSGSIGGQNLDNVAAVKGVEAVNKGSKTPVTATNDLDVTVLNAIPVKAPGGITVPLGDIVRLGAVNQYAQAADAGVSRAAAGAVSDAGVVDTTGGSAFPAEATVSLTPLLQAPLTSVVDDVSLRLQAITGVAALDAVRDKAPSAACTDLSDPADCRDYQITGGRLAMSAPALKTLVAALTGANGIAGQLDSTVNALTGTNGALTTALQSGRTSLLGSLPLSGLLGNLTPADFDGGTGLSVTVTSDVDGAVGKVLATKLSDGVVTIDLAAGTITVDLDKLLRASTGHGLNDLAPNTEVLSAKVISDLTKRIGDLLTPLADSVNTALTSALGAATVTVGGSLCAVGTGATCSTGTPDLGAGVIVDIDTTLAALLNGTATGKVTFKSTAGSQALDAGTLLTPLSAAVKPLFSASGVLATATTAVSAAVGDLVDQLGPVLTALHGLVSLKANVQEAGATEGSYREVALRLVLGAAAGTPLASVDLGKAEVGPNVLGVATPTTSEQPTATPTTPAGGVLPDTGADTRSAVLGGLGLLLVAAGSLLMRRRRTA